MNSAKEESKTTCQVLRKIRCLLKIKQTKWYTYLLTYWQLINCRQRYDFYKYIYKNTQF